MTILVTGGSGYIGSHTVLELLSNDYSVVVVDNCSNSSTDSLRRVESLSKKSITSYQVDLRNEQDLNAIFEKEDIDAVIHFAGYKAVGDSVKDPLDYYDNNLLSTIVLCRVMAKHGIHKLVFSSSATVYGLQETPEYVETMDMRPVNPYGRTKAMNEEILSDLCFTAEPWRVIALRYFNPTGAHPSGLIGEDPTNIPNNLFPYIMQVAVGKRAELSIFGDDYDTKDGTGVRDYIHVVDLAKGHVAAIENLSDPNTFATYNLGSGEGFSVYDVIKAVEAAAKKKIPYVVRPRRDGDLAIYYANPSKANKELNWKTKKTLQDARNDGWRWQSQNPNGYNIGE